MLKAWGWDRTSAVRKALQVILAVGGVFCIVIALIEVFIGASSIPNAIPVNEPIDSMLRFYAVMFGAFGAALLWCIRDVERKGQFVRFLAVVLFVGGLARVISALQVGMPPPFYIGLAAVELITPFALWFLMMRVEAASR